MSLWVYIPNTTVLRVLTDTHTQMGLTADMGVALSAHFKVDGAPRRVGGKNHYVDYACNNRISKKKVRLTCGQHCGR